MDLKKKLPLGIAVPKQHTRIKVDKTGNQKIIFDEKSFHATLLKWVAIAYLYNRKKYQSIGKIYRYNMRIDLYKNKKVIVVEGKISLKYSLEKLYEDGGYLYSFDMNNFVPKRGLGKLDMVASAPVKAVGVQRVKNPVLELKKIGVSFKFINTSKLL